MILTYLTFYRKFGVRLLPQVMTPILSDSKFLEFPMESIYHHLTYDGVLSGPANDDLLFRNIKRPIPVEFEYELTSLEGMPRKVGINALALGRDYYQTHRRMRLMKNVGAAVRDKQTLIVFNYSTLSKTYRYPQSLFAGYYKWKNIFTTAINKIVALTEETNRQHYIFTGVPTVIPSVQQMTIAATALNQTTLKVFRDSNSLILLELWKWFSEDSEQSLFSTIPKNKIHLVNLIFEESGKWCVINLGILRSFYKEKIDEKALAIPPEENYVIKSKQKVEGIQLNKRLLRMMMTLMEVRTLTAKNQVETSADDAAFDDVVVIEAPDADGDEEDDAQVQAETTLDYIEPYKEQLADDISVLAPLGTELDISALNDMTHDEFNAHIAGEDIILDDDLAQLNEIAKQIDELDANSEGDLGHIFASEDNSLPEDGVMNVCNKLAVDGLLSAAELKKFSKLSQSYKEIKSVDGTPLSEFMVIPPETLKLEDNVLMKDDVTVLDKTMLHSNLNQFTAKYVKDVLHKDYANTVMSLQKAGIAVTGYKIEKVVDVLGGYEDHVLKIQPVIGAPSTLRFKLPIVDEDGFFQNNGTKYRLRNQRGD